MGEVASIYDFLSKGGLPALALLILVGGHKQWWVFGWQYKELQAQVAEWRELALNGTLISEKAVGALDRVTRSTPAETPAREGRARGDR